MRGLHEPIGKNVRQLLPATYEDAVRYATAAEAELQFIKDEESCAHHINDRNCHEYSDSTDSDVGKDCDYVGVPDRNDDSDDHSIDNIGKKTKNFRCSWTQTHGPDDDRR